MKWYWHLLFLIFSTVAACFTANWLNQPLWQIVEDHPVSFDKYDPVRQEWTTLAGDHEGKNWWIETRSGRDPTVIRRLKLDLPPTSGPSPYLGSSMNLHKQPGDVLLCHDSVYTERDPDIRFENRFCILDSITGKVLRRFTIPNNPFGKIAGHGSRLAFAENGYIRLFDVSSRNERSLKLNSASCLTFSPDGKLLACIWGVGTFYFIDWEKAVLIEPIQPKPVASFCFINNDTLLLVHDQYINLGEINSRWRWDGVALRQVSPGIKRTTHSTWPMVKNTPTGKIHLYAGAQKDWPLQLKSIFQWLTERKLPIDRWFPKQWRLHWLVLDDQDRITREYDELQSNYRHQLYDQLSIEIKPDKGYTSTTVTLWNGHPTWPNALAAGMMCFLLLYVTSLIIARST